MLGVPWYDQVCYRCDVHALLSYVALYVHKAIAHRQTGARARSCARALRVCNMLQTSAQTRADPPLQEKPATVRTVALKTTAQKSQSKNMNHRQRWLSHHNSAHQRLCNQWPHHMHSMNSSTPHPKWQRPSHPWCGW